MKKSLLFTLSLVILVSCVSTRDKSASRKELRTEKKLAEQVIVKKAIESQRYIIKLDKIYFTGGGMADLIPRRNYIIVDGGKAIINAAYIGRQYGIRPIEGINMRGVSTSYQLKGESGKGLYEVDMKVENKSAAFNVYLSIGNSGTCNVSISSLMINSIRYRGQIVPIDKPVDKSDGIELQSGPDLMI